MLRSEEKRLVIRTDGLLWVVLRRLDCIHALGEQLVYFRLRKGRMENGIAHQVETAVEIFREKFTRDSGGGRIGVSKTRSERPAERVDFFGELVRGPFGGSLTKKLRRDARNSSEPRRFSLYAALYHNTNADERDARLPH